MTMRSRITTIALGLVLFVAAGALGYWGARALTGTPVSAPAAVPSYDEAFPVVVPVPFEGDAAAAIEILSDQVAVSRTAASDLGVPLEPTDTSSIELAPIVGTSSGTGRSGIDTSPSTAPAMDTTTPDGGEEPLLVEVGTPPEDGSVPAEERATDTCTDGGDDCPDGISGTILAVRDLPPLGGQAVFNPPIPGAGTPTGSPVCPARESREGTASFGVSTNRPARIMMEYRTLEWRTDRGGIPWTTYSAATPDAGDAAWQMWFADETASLRAPEAWIQTCFTLEDLPPRDDYQARFTFTDKEDPSVTARGYRLIPFAVTGRDGLVPGAQRRPTTALPIGIDQLFVGATRTPDQELAVAARPGTDAATCEIAGDENAIYDGTGTIRSVTTAESTIERSVLDDPAYPYLQQHSISVVERLDLEEGTDYVVCIYWLDDGPAFDRKVVTETETIAVSTPEAYRPKLVAQQLTNLFGDVGRITVSIPSCIGTGAAYDITDTSSTVRDRLGTLQTLTDPIELCTIERRLNDITRRGIRVDMTVTQLDGTTTTGSAYLRTDVTCRTVPCLLRLNEIAMIPLPEVTAGDGECGSGFGTGCLTGTRSAGDAVIEIRYLPSTGTGLANWLVGVPAPFEDAPPPLTDDPRIAVTTRYELIDGRPERGARATVTFVADRPVTLDVSVADVLASGEPCSIGPIDMYDSPTRALRHTVTLDPLCLGQGYRLTVTARDESGNIATVVDQIPRTFDNTVELFVPPARLTTEIAATISAPHADHSHTVYVRPVRATTFDATGPVGSSLGWTWPTEDRDAARRSGWELYGGSSGRATACGRPGAGDLEVFARRTARGVPTRSLMYAAQEGTRITFVVDVYANEPIAGGVRRDCVPGDIEESIVLQADPSIEDLLSGITLTSDSGLAEFTLKAISFRRDLDG